MAIINTGTSANKISSGTTAQRPSEPIKGHFRFNTDLYLFEYYNGTTWIQMKV